MFHLFAVANTRLPMGPARLVRVRDRDVPALAPVPAARQPALSGVGGAEGLRT